MFKKHASYNDKNVAFWLIGIVLQALLLFYGNEIWGFGTRDSLDKLYNSKRKYLVKMTKT